MHIFKKSSSGNEHFEVLVLETVFWDYFGLFIWIYICIKIFIRGESWPKLRSDYLLEDQGIFGMIFQRCETSGVIKNTYQSEIRHHLDVYEKISQTNPDAD